jgi:hypothetical protein
MTGEGNAMMTDQELQKLVEQISLQFFCKPFRHLARFNSRLKTTGGRYLLRTHDIELNPRHLQEHGVEELIGIIKHELCHYVSLPAAAGGRIALLQTGIRRAKSPALQVRADLPGLRHVLQTQAQSRPGPLCVRALPREIAPGGFVACLFPCTADEATAIMGKSRMEGGRGHCHTMNSLSYASGPNGGRSTRKAACQ